MKLSTFLSNSKHKMDKFITSGAFRLNYSEFSSVYIGRSVKTRYLETYISYKIQKTYSTLTNYFLENQHIYLNLYNTSILQNSYENTLETIEIYKYL